MSELHAEALVSIYLPTQRAGSDTRENAIRMKNRLSDAQRQLEERGWQRDDAEAYLRPAHDLVNDNDFWQHQLDGLAVLLGPDGLQTWRVPQPFEELTVVADALHLKPLLPLVTGDGTFHVLAVSLAQARLYRATHYSVSEVDLGDTPTSLAEALRFDEFEKDRGQQEVSRGGGGTGAIAFGVDDLDERRKTDILRFFRALDDGVRRRLGTEHAPLVFVGVDFLFPLYREANHYDTLLDDHVRGNPDTWGAVELHARAWDVARPHFDRVREEVIERLHAQAGTGRASADLAEVVTAAHDGRVETLFVALGRQRWGRFDPQRRVVEAHDPKRPDSRDLLDLAAMRTLRNGGRVFAVAPDEVPMVRPGGDGAAARDGAPSDGARDGAPGHGAGDGGAPDGGDGAPERGAGLAALFRY